VVGIQDGIEYVGNVQKVGKRSVWLDFTDSGGDSTELPVSFEP
jgi:hypothetical protein